MTPTNPNVTGTTTYICSECGEFIREEKEVRHGF